MFEQLITSDLLVRAGKLRPIVVTHRSWVPTLPGVTTFAEAGVTSFLDHTWVDLRPPSEIIAGLDEKVGESLETPEARGFLTDRGLDVAEDQSPKEFAAFIREEVDRLATLARASDIALDDCKEHASA